MRKKCKHKVQKKIVKKKFQNHGQVYWPWFWYVSIYVCGFVRHSNTKWRQILSDAISLIVKYLYATLVIINALSPVKVTRLWVDNLFAGKNIKNVSYARVRVCKGERRREERGLHLLGTLYQKKWPKKGCNRPEKSRKKNDLCQWHKSTNGGLISEDRSTEATLLFTIPRSGLSRLQRIYLWKY